MLNSTIAKTPDEEELRLRERLAEHFAPKVEKLEELLGCSMGWSDDW